MPRKKAVKKKSTEFIYDCACGEKSRIFELERGYMGHCISCGSVIFFDNPQLLERLKFGGKLCPHKVESKPCQNGGHTTFCRQCHIRAFYYNNGEEK